MPDTATLANQRPREVRLSPDGNRLYSAGADGFVRVYDAGTGGLIDSWHVGQNLGGMDISPDGSFLVIVERNLTTTYKVDTATGASTSYIYATPLLFDVAVLSDGTALFTETYPGSGSTTLRVLDFATGTYTAGPGVNQSAVLSRSATGQYVLIGEPNSSGGPIDIYQTGTGIIANTGAGGFNWGIQAFSGSLVAQYIYNEGIHIYNASLQRQVTLTTWNNGKVTDLAFSADSAWLYILENQDNSIIKVSTANWGIEDTIPVAADVGNWQGQVGATNGGRLILDPQGRYFSVVTDTGFVLVENPDAPPIEGTGAADVLKGALFADTIFGYAGNDVISGFNGNDRIFGGEGADLIEGNAGNDVLDGGTGVDAMSGGIGDDVYFVDNALDTVTEAASQGFDIVWASASYTLGAGVDVEVLSARVWEATDAIDLTGNEIVNTLIGNAGANRLHGGAGNDIINGREGDDVLFGDAGADTLNGGTGNDIYVVEDSGDAVFEYANEGTADVIFSAVSYTLPEGSEIEVLSARFWEDTTALNLTGSSTANTIIGNAGANVLDGGGGNDAMSGREGNDTYVVDSAGDAVNEGSGQGFDVVFSSVSFALGAGSEVEVLSARFWEATSAIALTGNELVNTIIGNAGANILHGGAGNDIINGREGDDVLWGDAGADTMNGGTGSDIYVVEDSGDAVFENSGEGTDTIFSAVSYTLPEGSEIEILSARFWEDITNINLTGSSTANTLIGNAGNNILDGAGGVDNMSGREGNDTYIVDNAADVVTELSGQGTDILLSFVSYTLAADSAIEILSARFWEDVSAISLTGNAIANVVIGNAGANVINGGAGNDTLTGNAGADAFRFDTTLGNGNIDTITDFSAPDDIIQLDHAAFVGLGLGALNANAFVIGNAALDADDRILYDQASGALYFDADGNGAGAAIQFATLQGAPVITASDFTVI